jgi:PAS domain S-box-containing protein
MKRALDNTKKIKEIQQNESDKFKMLFDYAPDAYLLINTSGIIVDGNLASEKLFKIKKEMILGKNIFEANILSPDQYKKAADIIVKSIKEMKTYREEYALKIDSKYIYIEVASCPLNIDNKVHILALCRDITERKILEQNTRNDKKLTKSILDAIPHAVLGLEERNIIFANNSVSNVFGWSTEELAGKSTRILYRSDVEFEDLGKTLYPKLKKQRNYSLEYVCRHKDGKEINCLISASIIGEKLENKKIVAMYEDISARKQAENSYFQEKELMKDYLNTANLIVLAIDNDNNVRMINKKGCEILGYNEDKIVGKNWFENFIPKSTKKELKALISDLRSGKPGTELHENMVLTKSGKERIIRWNNTLLKNIEGNITAVLSTGEDITEHKKYENSLKDSEKRLKAILEHIQAGIIIIDPEKFEVVEVNPLAARMIGLPREKIIGKTCQGFICNYEKGKCPVINLGKTIINEECEMLRADKTKIPILKSVMEVEMGGKKYLVDSFVDISEQKKNQEESERKIIEMEKFSKLTVGRELKMVELKNKVKELEDMLKMKT